MSRPMKKSAPAFFGLGCFEPVFFQRGDDLYVNRTSGHSRANVRQGHELRCANGRNKITLSIGSGALQKRTCHVAEISVAHNSRKNDKDDQLIRTQRTRATAVRIAGLISPCSDRVDRSRARFEAGCFDDHLEALRSEYLSTIIKFARFDF